MAKKPMSEERRKKMAENLAKARAARSAKKEVSEIKEEPKSEVSATDLLLQKLMQEIDELKKQKNPNMTVDTALAYTAQMQGVHIGNNGVQGKKFKYPVEESYYPNPLDRLYDEPKLSRFNLRENYLFTWEVTGVEYEKYGITYAEPRFTVKLFRRMFDDAGEPTGQMALINTQIVHEDEIVARVALDKLGLTEQFGDFKDAMSEVRYYRIRQWLLDLFTPAHVEQHSRQPRTMVVDGKVVEMYDTETLIDGADGIAKASSVSNSVRV